jgi:hypothetical protein
VEGERGGGKCGVGDFIFWREGGMEITAKI